MKQPEVKIVANNEMRRAELAGWDAFNSWAIRNSGLWRQTTERCRHAELSEEDRLRLLCSLLLEQYGFMADQATRMALKLVAIERLTK